MFLTIIKSLAIRPGTSQAKFIMRHSVCNVAFTQFWVLLLGLSSSPGIYGQDASAQTVESLRRAARAEAAKVHQAAQTNYDQAKSAETAWRFGRACFDLAEFPKDKREQAQLAERGIALCQEAVSLEPTNAAAHYYLGLNFGQLSRTKGIGALKIVGPMQRAFETCIKLDEKFDNAGPHRNLGYLFRDAPSWAGIGNKAKAKHHLERAVKLAPTHPENELALLEGRIQWGEKQAAKAELPKIRELLAQAKPNLNSAAQRVSFREWEELLEKLSAKLPSN